MVTPPGSHIDMDRLRLLGQGTNLVNPRVASLVAGRIEGPVDTAVWSSVGRTLWPNLLGRRWE